MTPRIQYLLLFLVLFCLTDANATAQRLQAVSKTDVESTVEGEEEEAPPRRRVQTIRRTQDISVDGRLDEAMWQEAPVIDGFKQREPVEGAAPTERTAVRVLYDNEALYIGARMYDASPDSILARLGRRDADLNADAFGFFIDPYLDRRTGFYFAINAAGTLMDGVLYNDDWDDSSWDGVWLGKVKIDDEGWTAEMKIPYSQLRFHEEEVYTWGINFRRDIARKNEQQYLVYTPRSESGFVSRFIDLEGIKAIKPPRQLEVTPYLTTQAAFTQAEDGDPFNDGSTYTPDVGADFKVGLTSNLTLNGTVNPDFGQVEVDPAVVNLSDRETFFPEKRAFFIEGESIFNFGYGGSNNNWGFNWGNPNFFYSRRIGRAPQGSLPDDYDYADRPDGTRILGAAKLTGKVGGNWNVGTVQALTERATAELSLDGKRFSAEVEPMAYYGIVRAQREFQDGRQALGFMSTTALRRFSEDRLRDEINSEAYGFGVDGWTFLDQEKVWVVTGWMGGTHVRGTQQRILDVQQNSNHYFQRPDSKALTLDSTATSLTGLSGRVMLNKQSGNWTTNAAIGFVSPGFDANDTGFQFRTNVINAHAVISRRWTEPRSFYRRINLNAALFRSLDFDGNTTWTGLFMNNFWQFQNYYSIYWGGAVNPETVSNSRTRGGPLTLNPPGVEFFGGAETDSRKPWVFELEGFTYQTASGDNVGLDFEVEWKPAANVSLSVSPGVSWNKSKAQWIGAFDDPTATETFGQRYVFGELDQVTVSSSVRLNWTFTPQLSLQLFAQPLISAGNYDRFKELARPKSYDFNVFGEANGSTIEETTNDDAGLTYVVDPDGDEAATTLSFDNPDFNFKSLRGTAVLRWEFRPGSTLFLVWTQTRSHFEDSGEFQFSRSRQLLFDEQPDNIFVLKFTYWLSR
ncbi:MAG TPA: DUF5916 domain-containing protein [Rhodothermales bacterium]|nr:DUF5916 domain-containing protein [Rhodothermales bacterium]